MHTTTIPDETLRHCAVASENNARAVKDALTMVIEARTPDGLTFAATRLRHALVLLASGEESSAHDGSTYQARHDAAKRALEAWDLHKGSLKKVVIRIGSRAFECEQGLALSLGYELPYANDETRTARGGSEKQYGGGKRLTPDQALAVAISEGLSGELAVMRAIAVRTSGMESADSRSALEAAKMHREAANDELRAAQIRSATQKRAAEG